MKKKVKHFWTEPKCDILHRDLKRNAMTSCHFWAGRGWIKSAHLKVPANRHNWLLSTQSPFLQHRQNQDIFITQKVQLPTTPKKTPKNNDHHPAPSGCVNQEQSARECSPCQPREGRRDSAPACPHFPLWADSGEVLHRHTLAPKEQN